MWGGSFSFFCSCLPIIACLSQQPIPAPMDKSNVTHQSQCHSDLRVLKLVNFPKLWRLFLVGRISGSGAGLGEKTQVCHGWRPFLGSSTLRSLHCIICITLGLQGVSWKHAAPSCTVCLQEENLELTAAPSFCYFFSPTDS